MKINILQGAFFPVPPIKGGAIETSWHALGKEFSRQGHRVTHISKLDCNFSKSENIDGVNHLRVRGNNAVKNSLLLKVLELPYVLRARKEMPVGDILVTHAFWAPLLFPNARYGLQYIHVGRYPKGQLKFYNKAARFQVPTNSIYNVCRKQISDREQRIKTLPYPLTWKPSSQIDFNQKKKIILYAGRIHPEKGIKELIDAWINISEKNISGWKLRLIGPWSEEQGGGGKKFLDELKNLAKKSKNPVEFKNPIFQRELLKSEMENAKFFIYPSRAAYGETFGLAVLEAMSCGCIPIVSELPCFTDFITFGRDGFCVGKKRNITNSIQKKLCEVLILSESNLNKIALSAWNRSKEYELEKVAKMYLDDFFLLLQK